MRIVPGHQRAIVEASTEIARLGIAYDLPRVVGLLEIAHDQSAQRQSFGTRDFDRSAITQRSEARYAVA
ncbi:MAG TPA: hypothetical protein VE422_28665 [Terriglobia bacterium]|nr:hypothetical protein [Terriglobia bacterium]